MRGRRVAGDNDRRTGSELKENRQKRKRVEMNEMNEMNETGNDDSQVEQMLRDHLKQSLDVHLGASSRRFAQHLAESSRNREDVIPFPVAASRSKPGGGRHDGPRFGSLWSIGL